MSIPDEVRWDLDAILAAHDETIQGYVLQPEDMDKADRELDWIENVRDWLGSQHEPEALRELMANEAHAVWANWMAYLFLQSQKDVKGRVVIPRLLVERWERQVATHYIDLTESEKEAVGTIADRYLKLMGG